jgi:hypothetical protein
MEELYFICHCVKMGRESAAVKPEPEDLPKVSESV